MRALRPMTFAERQHELVICFLRCKHLPMDDFYDVVIFGYLSAVQQYFRNPPAGVEFKAMAFRAMKDTILRDREYAARAKRSGITVGLDDVENALADPKQDTERQVEDKVLLEQVVNIATPREAGIINLLIDGFALHEATRFLKMSKGAAVSCMEEFYGWAKVAVG